MMEEEMHFGILVFADFKMHFLPESALDSKFGIFYINFLYIRIKSS